MNQYPSNYSPNDITYNSVTPPYPPTPNSLPSNNFPPVQPYGYDYSAYNTYHGYLQLPPPPPSTPYPAPNVNDATSNSQTPVPANHYTYAPGNSSYYAPSPTDSSNSYRPSHRNSSGSSKRDGSNKKYDRLPSPDSFIRECKSGIKSNERLSKEELIKKNLNNKSRSPETSPSRRKIKESSHNDNYASSNSKRDKLMLKSPRDLFNKKQKSEEFLKKWR